MSDHIAASKVVNYSRDFLFFPKPRSSRRLFTKNEFSKEISFVIAYDLSFVSIESFSIIKIVIIIIIVIIAKRLNPVQLMKCYNRTIFRIYFIKREKRDGEKEEEKK